MLWVSIGAIDFVITLYNLRDSLLSYKWIDILSRQGKIDNPSACYFARAHVYLHLGLFVIAMTVILGGVAAGLSPPANVHDPVSKLQIIVISSIFVLVLVNLAISIGSVIVRRHLLGEEYDGNRRRTS